ncbi:MAG: hypothetical protein Q4C04_01385 [Clostridia bacterium]|nr:hypothetical protein [Clostridia bacterium]
MKRLISCILTIAFLFCAVAVPLSATDAVNSHSISLALTVDPEAELSVGGALSWLRFDIHNGGVSEYTLNNAIISCPAIGLNERLESVVTVSAQAAREFYLYGLNIPDSVLDTELTFELSWVDISYGPLDIYQETPIYINESASATIVIERFIEPVISIQSSCNIELAKPDTTVEFVYTLENATKFDMTNLVLYDEGIVDTTIVLPSTSLLAGASMTVTLPVVMGEENLISQPLVTYTVRNQPTQTAAAEAVTVECAIIELQMSVQSFAATTEGVEFAITVTNVGTQPITNIRLYDEINTLIDGPFDLAASQSKSISYVATAAQSATQTRYISFHAEGTDCFLEPYIYNDTTSYPIIPYVDSSQIDISLSATLSFASSADTENATVFFEIINNSEVPISNASLTEQYYLGSQSIADFAVLSAGVTAFSYDITLSGEVTTLAFALNAFDPSGNPCSTPTVVIDVSAIRESLTAPSTPMIEGDTIGGTIDTSGIARAIRIALIIICAIVAIGVVVALILYYFEFKLKSAIPEDFEIHTTGKIIMDETAAEFPAEIAVAVDETGARTPMTAAPFEKLGYVAPTRLRYISYEEEKQRVAERKPLPSEPEVIETKTAVINRPANVRLIRSAYEKKPRPLVWNEVLRVNGLTADGLNRR